MVCGLRWWMLCNHRRVIVFILSVRHYTPYHCLCRCHFLAVMETLRHRRLCCDAILLAHLTGHYLSATRETTGAPYRALIGCAAAHSESNVLAVVSHTGHETCSASPQMESEMEKREK